MIVAGTTLILSGFFCINLFGQKVGGGAESEGSAAEAKRKNSDLQEEERGLLAMPSRVTDDGASLAGSAEVGQINNDDVVISLPGRS